MLERGDRLRYGVLLVLGALVALLEAAAITLVAPLVALVTTAPATNEGLIGQLRALVTWLLGAPATRRSEVLGAAALLLGVFIFKNALATALTAVRFRFVHGRHVLAARALFAAYLRRDYVDHVQHNSADLLRNVNDEVRHVFVHVLPALWTLAAELSLLAAIAALLFAADAALAAAAVLGFGVVGGLFYAGVRRKNAELGEQHQQASGAMNKAVSEGLAALKELKVLGREQSFVEAHAVAAERFARATRYHRSIEALPRYVVETVAVGTLVLVLFVADARGASIAALTPLWALLLVAAMKATPALNRVISALAQLRYYAPSVQVVAADVYGARDAGTAHAGASADAALGFEREIAVEDVTFRYPGATRAALDAVSLRIARGEVVGLVGASGAGKTTLADVLLGLLRPCSGGVTVDEHDIAAAQRVWRRRVGYVAQHVALTDDSLRCNVALGVPADEIDHARLQRALAAAQLEPLVATLEHGLDTALGEGGVRLSGGERQRVGIARALYVEPQLLVIDEGTSSLDYRTERQIADTLHALRGERTLVIIAHRLSTLRGCDRLVMLGDGAVIDAGTYDELIARCELFRSLVEGASATEPPS